jgi:hypothetical protein
MLLFHMEAKGKFKCDANSRVTPLLRFPVEQFRRGTPSLMLLVEHPRSSPLMEPEGLVEA